MLEVHQGLRDEKEGEVDVECWVVRSTPCGSHVFRAEDRDTLVGSVV